VDRREFSARHPSRATTTPSDVRQNVFRIHELIRMIPGHAKTAAGLEHIPEAACGANERVAFAKER
jgi:hypothetical protein